MQNLQSTDQEETLGTMVEVLMEEIRMFLLINKDLWPRIMSEMPELGWHSMMGFTQQHKKCLNPTIGKLAQFERACRIIDPEFLNS